VNKVASKVELQFDFETCGLWTEKDKARIRQKLGNRLSAAGKLQIICQEDRSQFKNKMLAQKKLLSILSVASKIPTPRKRTKRSKASIEKRLEAKKYRALLKMNRSRNFD